MRSPTQKTGDRGEKYTVRYLKKHGWKIVERNYRKKYGEIDIIARKRDLLAFVEVKTRRQDSPVPAWKAVDREKQRKIIMTAKAYLAENRLEINCRFDVCEVCINSETQKLLSINYIENAFTV